MRRGLLVVPALALSLAACGGTRDTATGAPGSSATPSGAPSGSAGPSGAPAPSSGQCPVTATPVAAPAGIPADPAAKPTVPPSSAPPPAGVTVADLTVGTGVEATTLSQVEVKYVGALYATGKEFDSSWKQGPDQTFPFTVCTQGTIPGFSIAPTGMKVGGRRVVTIPAEFGYGAQGSPPDIPGGAALVFVIDLVKVTPPVG